MGDPFRGRPFKFLLKAIDKVDMLWYNTVGTVNTDNTVLGINRQKGVIECGLAFRESRTFILR